ncbi:MAG TPA: hypothetical protein VMV72_03035 [Verrucomicrobiae bacterium]|nr:hypothetical protein [Verrucomicrobiae bacterium]
MNQARSLNGRGTAVIRFLERAAVVWIVSLTAIATDAQLLNGSFELGYGLYTNTSNPSSVTTAAVGWVQYGNGLRISTNETGDANSARTGAFSLQCFGSNFGQSEGACQEIADGVSPGQTWTISGYARIPSSDPLTNASPIGMQPFGCLRLAFMDTNGAEIDYFDAPDIYSADGLDTWLSVSVTGTAPAGAARLKVDVMEIGFFGNPSGTIYFDDLTVIPEPSTFLLVSMSLLGGFRMYSRRKNRHTD